MNITVFLGSSMGNGETYKEKAQELGRWIAEKGHTLVYGGSKVGLMGVLAKAAVSSGGKVIGIEPSFFVEQEKQYDSVTELIVTNDMEERKEKLLQMGDAFVAFPGGTGTLEEISQAISQSRLGFLNKPCIFYNIEGYYDTLREMFDRMEEDGFLSKEDRKKIAFLSSIDEIGTKLGIEEGGSV